MKDLMGMMKQVKEMQSRMEAVQAELDAMEIDGQSGAGLVKVVMNGKAELKDVQIDASLLKEGEQEVLEDLIVAAAQDAKRKVELAVQEKMAEVTGGLPLPPGMKLF